MKSILHHKGDHYIEELSNDRIYNLDYMKKKGESKEAYDARMKEVNRNFNIKKALWEDDVRRWEKTRAEMQAQTDYHREWKEKMHKIRVKRAKKIAVGCMICAALGFGLYAVGFFHLPIVQDGITKILEFLQGIISTIG